MAIRSIIRKFIISLVTLKLMLFFMIIGVHAEIDFSSAPVWSAGEGTWAITPSWGDFNQDGWLDIYIGGGADAALMADVIYFGSDTGMATVPGWTSTYIAGSCITNVSDLNNDGYPDVIVADIGGIGSRTPKPQSIYFNQGGYFNTIPDWSSTPLATWATVVGDIDMDGDLDIVCPDDAFDQMSTLKIFINNGGSFNTTPDWESDLIYGFTGGCFSDIDLDGDLDLAMNGGAMGVQIFHNLNGTLETTPSWQSADVWGGSGVSFGDMDGDGYPELAASSFAGQEMVIFQNHGGSFNVYPEWRFPNSSRLSHVSWGDADGDNDLDLCLVEQSDEFCIYENLGGILSESPQWGHTPGGWPQINGWGDFDNDGLTDTTEIFTGDGIRKLFVLGKMNLHKVTGIEFDGTPLDISQYCCSMVEGIVSTAPTPASGSNIIVSYTFSRDIDLLGGTTGTYIYENYANRHLRASYNIETHGFKDENDDGRFESGETAQFFFTLCNSGIADTDIIVTVTSTDPEIAFTSSTVNFASIDGEGTCLDNLSSPIEFIIPEIETARIDSFFITIESNNGELEGPAIFVRTIGTPSILLVDDDRGSNYEEVYKSHFANMQLPFNIWNKLQNGSPTGTDLSSYKAVIWYTGDNDTDYITSEDITAMKYFINNNGRFLLTGQGLAAELDNDDPDFLEDYLHSNYLGEIYYRANQKGFDGAIIGDGFSVVLDNQDPSLAQNISVRNGGQTEFYSGIYQDRITAVSYLGVHRILFFTWGLETLINDNPLYSTRDALMVRIMDFLLKFNCGDANGNEFIDILDLVYIINYKYKSGPIPTPPEAADVNSDEDINILDIVLLLNYIYKDGPDPICP